MATVNEKLLDKAVSHAIDMQHYSNGEVRRMIVLLNKADKQLAAQLILALENLPRDGFTVQRLDALLVEVNKLNGGTYQSIKKEFGNDLLELTRTEASYQYDLFQSVIPVDVSISKIAPEAVYAAAVARPFQISKDKAIDLSSYLEGLSTARAASIKEAIKLGFITGETTDQIVRRIMGTKSKNYADGLMEGSRQHIEGMVRTSVSHISNFTSQRFYEANSGMIKGVMWVSTLDGLTSATCMARDGRVYPINSGPRPPAHINCLPGDALVLSRSGISAVSKRWFDGEVVIIKISSGRELSCTPNHPILTNRGWVAAKSLNLVDKIACDGGVEWESIRSGDHDNVPPCIHDVVESFLSEREVSAVPVPTSTPDFHGDGMNGQVAIIGTYLGLSVGNNPEFTKKIEQSNFIMRASGFGFRNCYSSFSSFINANNPAFTGNVCGSGNRALFFIGALRHTSELLFAAIPRFDASFRKERFNRRNSDIKVFGDPFDTNPFIEHFSRNVEIETGKNGGIFNIFGLGFSILNIFGIKNSSYNFMSHLEVAGNIGNGHAIGVQSNDYVGVNVNSSAANCNVVVSQNIVDICNRTIKRFSKISRAFAVLVSLANQCRNLLSVKLKLFNSGSNCNASRSQNIPNGKPVLSIDGSANFLDSHALIVEGNNGIGINGLSPSLESIRCIESIVDGSDVDAKLASNILNGDAGSVFLDDIVSINVRKFSGHVYNLETGEGFYSANGIITHNCRSRTVAVVKSWRELGVDMDEFKSTRASMDGQVPDDMTYQQWLEKQPTERQDEILGPTKGKLFRAGQTVERFVDNKGKALTIAQLRERNAKLFDKLGL